jgi:SAM-dependent methyltransferase
MSVFNEYSKFYDIIYKDKNYEEECNYIEDLLAHFGEKQRGSILDLGCGTGTHALIWGKRGWRVKGIDRSDKMLDIARKKAVETNSKVAFSQGDLSEFDESSKYDVVVSMFAVVSYLSRNESLKHFFKKVSEVLHDGGYLIFDTWYGPGVLTDPPSDRYKILENEDDTVIRFTKSKLNSFDNTVDVGFKIIQLSDNKLISHIDEVHTMRYFFVPEVKLFLEAEGLELVAAYPVNKIGGELSNKDWNTTFVARKNFGKV